MYKPISGFWAAMLIVSVGVVLLIALGNPSRSDYQACLKAMQSQETCTYYLR